jgi:glutathione synthase/RimK-type ligase-like ATP-grasp enzyme
MEIAIHDSDTGFHPVWIEYCKANQIPFRKVNMLSNDIVQQLTGCSAIMWHFSQSNSGDILGAKQILQSLQKAGFIVFPDYDTSWHFDDKVAQKYLFEAMEIPAVKSFVFYNKKNALEWAENHNFPVVFKLRSGAGSQNVRLVKTLLEARKIIEKAFGNGFKQYDGVYTFSDRFRKFRQGKIGYGGLLKGIGRMFIEPYYAKVMGKELGYVYFQDFLPNNNSDTRIIVIDGKAFALKRMVRKDDFRASGSGDFRYDKEEFDERCIHLAFISAKKLGSDCAAFDFIFDQNNNPLIVEISYGFVKEVYYACTGYWDENLRWHDRNFNSPDWMIELMIKKIQNRK